MGAGGGARARVGKRVLGQRAAISRQHCVVCYCCLRDNVSLSPLHTAICSVVFPQISCGAHASVDRQAAMTNPSIRTGATTAVHSTGTANRCPKNRKATSHCLGDDSTSQLCVKLSQTEPIGIARNCLDVVLALAFGRRTWNLVSRELGKARCDGGYYVITRKIQTSLGNEGANHSKKHALL